MTMMTMMMMMMMMMMVMMMMMMMMIIIIIIIITIILIIMIPMTRVLERMEVGYQLKKGGSRINHLMFMDDIKMFGRGIKETDTLVETVRIVSGDIRMEFGIEKCALVNIQRGEVTRTEGIQLPDGNNIKDIDETGYKYLGIIEAEEIKH